jgi:hypothetical protein
VVKVVLPALAVVAQPVRAKVAHTGRERAGLLAPAQADSLALEREADPAAGRLGQVQADWSAPEMAGHLEVKVG